MNVERHNFAKQSSTFSVTYKLARKMKSELSPIFSISCAHLRAFSGLTFPLNPFVFHRLRTSRDNYRGWGCLALSATALPIRVNPCSSVVSFSPPATRLFSILYKRVRKSLKTSTFKSLYFHTHAHSFAGSPVFSTTSQKHTGGYTPILSDSGIFGPLACRARVRALLGARQDQALPLGDERLVRVPAWPERRATPHFLLLASVLPCILASASSPLPRNPAVLPCVIQL